MQQKGHKWWPKFLALWEMSAYLQPLWLPVHFDQTALIGKATLWASVWMITPAWRGCRSLMTLAIKFLGRRPRNWIRWKKLYVHWSWSWLFKLGQWASIQGSLSRRLLQQLSHESPCKARELQRWLFILLLLNLILIGWDEGSMQCHLCCTGWLCTRVCSAAELDWAVLARNKHSIAEALI